MLYPVPMTATSLDWDEITETDADVRGIGTSRTIELGELPERYRPREIPPPAPQLRGTKEYGRVVYQIRALLAVAVLLLAGALLAMVVIGHEMKTGGAAVSVGTPVTMTASVAGPDMAADYFVHVWYADGTEADLTTGTHVLDDPVRVEFGVTALPTGETACRIGIDGVRVAEQVATAGTDALCRWIAR